jgi:hypothetical protein
LPFGSPRHSPLPTGRPDSPSGLDRTKSGVLPAISFIFLALPKAECLGKLHVDTSIPVKLRSLDEVKRNPGLFNAAGNSRIPLRFIQATGMRSTSARGARVKDIGNKRVQGHGLPFLHEQKR